MSGHARVVFINRFFHPDHSATSQMLSDLAFALARRGLSVKVVTSRQRYDAPEAALPCRECINGVEIHRVWTSRFGRRNLLGRAIDYATFYLTAAWQLLRIVRRGDAVVAKTDPPMFSVLAWPVARLRGAKLINWLQDIFPEVAERIGVGSGGPARIAFGAMRQLRDLSLTHADMNVAVGERMAERMGVLGVERARVSQIPNWADGAYIRPIDHASNCLRREWGLSGDFVVGYSGNLGRAHEAETLIGAVGAVRRREASAASGGLPIPPVKWLFIGGGALIESMRAELVRLGLAGCVDFRPYAPREHLAASLSAADVHLVSLRPELEGLVVPSKFYGIAAAGRPTIFIGDSDGEIARLVARYACGRTVPQGDGEALADAVLDLAGQPELCRTYSANARHAFVEGFDLQVAVDRWQVLIERVTTAA